jgi:hypothetical protein
VVVLHLDNLDAQCGREKARVLAWDLLPFLPLAASSPLGSTLVLQEHYSDVTIVLQEHYSDITIVLRNTWGQRAEGDVVDQGVTRVLQG